MGDWTYIITNLLNLQAISWKQTGQTDLLLSCLNKEKIAVVLTHFRGSSKGSPRHQQKERNTLLRCNAYTVLGVQRIICPVTPVTVPSSLGIIGRWKELFTWTLYAMCSMVSLGLKIHLAPIPAMGNPASRLQCVGQVVSRSQRSRRHLDVHCPQKS